MIHHAAPLVCGLPWWASGSPIGKMCLKRASSTALPSPDQLVHGIRAVVISLTVLSHYLSTRFNQQVLKTIDLQWSMRIACWAFVFFMIWTDASPSTMAMPSGAFHGVATGSTLPRRLQHVANIADKIRNNKQGLRLWTAMIKQWSLTATAWPRIIC